jgi:serine/threonine protein phosphatase PrpC
MTEVVEFCPTCQAPLQPGDQFCESCGSRLPDVERDEAGGDRVEVDLGTAAAVSDRGLVHRRNEDSFHIELGGEHRVAVVVCDGISTASAGNVAAHNAAQAACSVLVRAMSEPGRDPGAATMEAIQAANGAVANVEWTTRTSRVDPSCTIVSALYREDGVAIGWVGDSRAYWISADGNRQLTVDDSVAEEGIAAGFLTPEQAAKSPFLHSITHWVGPDAPERPPRVAVFRPERSGRLLLCTDGLWNYAPTIDELASYIDSLPDGASAAAIARSLTDMAVSRGGRDNITVAVVDVDPA